VILMEQGYRDLIERAGGIFVGVRGDVVLFRDGPEGSILSHYLFACRTVFDIQLALKSTREHVRELTSWEMAG
jgi:hypothetical protein